MDEKEEDKKKKADVPIFYIALAILLLLLSSILISILSITEMPYYGETESYEIKFPLVEVDLYHDEYDTQIIIKHIDGAPLNWSIYKIIISNTTVWEQTTISSIEGEITGGQTTVFSNKTYTSMDDVKFKIEGRYYIEIFNLKENKSEFIEEVVCETGIGK